MKWEARVVGQRKIDPNEFIDLDHVHLDSADFSRRSLSMFGSVGSRLVKCRFDNAQIDDASFGAGREMSEYIECSFDGLRFWHGSGFARFVRCSFKDIDVQNWLCFGTEMIDCVFSGRMKRCIFNGTPMEEQRTFLGRERNEFHGNDFSGADLVDVAFRTGIDLTKQRLPSGPQYLYLPDAPAAFALAKSAAQQWSDPGLRKEALSFLDSESFELKGGQHQLLLRADDYSRSREVVDKVFALLRANA